MMYRLLLIKLWVLNILLDCDNFFCGYAAPSAIATAVIATYNKLNTYPQFSRWIAARA